VIWPALIDIVMLTERGRLPRKKIGAAVTRPDFGIEEKNDFVLTEYREP